MEIKVNYEKGRNTGSSKMLEEKEYYLINTESLIQLIEERIENPNSYEISKFHITVICGSLKDVKEALLSATFEKELEIIVQLGRVDTYNLVTKNVKEVWSIKSILLKASKEGIEKEREKGKVRLKQYKPSSKSLDSLSIVKE